MQNKSAPKERYRSIILPSKQKINGYVKQIGKLYKVFKRRFGLSFFVADIGRLRNFQCTCNLSLSEIIKFSLLYKSLLKVFHNILTP